MPEFPTNTRHIFVDASDKHTSGTAPAICTASSSADTKGSYSQIIASTPYDSFGLTLRLFSFLRNSREYLVDIALGAASSEQIIIPNILVDAVATNRQGSHAYVPLFIPKGSRISARCQSNLGSATCAVGVVLYGEGFQGAQGLSRCDNYGADTANTNGVTIDPGASSNTKGAWTQLTASTTNDIRWMLFNLSCRRNTSTQTEQWMFDIGVGAASSEEIIFADFYVITSKYESLSETLVGFPMYVPAGSRLAVRSQSNLTGSPDRLLDCVILGFS